MRTVLSSIITSVLLGLWISACAQDERPRQPFDHDILAETFGYGPDTPSLVDFEELYQGCPSRDCIPSIENPKYIPADEANFLGDDDLVMALDINRDRRAFPARILDYHEIVNGTIGGQPVAVTWCPLCGSGVAFDPVIDGEVVEFGVSGVLHNSDLVMYDRKTNSLWQQITGQAIMGPRKGERLEFIPMTMTDWKTWREAHPETLVLSTETGFGRDYGRRPYGDYEASGQLAFPVSQRDFSVHPKAVVFGFDIDGRALAVTENALEAGSPVTVDLDGRSLEFIRRGDGSVSGRDRSTGKEYHAIRLFWFAWYTFNPDTIRID